MKILPAKQEEGSTLMVALFIALAIGIVLASYLGLISSRHKISVRSMDWNAAIPVLEAGVEEAMTHLKDDPASPTANGWTAGTIGGQQVYTKQRTFADGSYFYVTIYNATASNPLIYSSGFVPSPLVAGQYISRTVRAGATNPPTVFTGALAASGTVTLSGGGLVDGFNSAMGNYDASTNRSATGGISTSSSAVKAVDIGTAHVYGTVTTGPGGTLASGGGAAGDVAWNDGTHTGFEPGWTNNNMNVAFPTNSPPTGTVAAPAVTAIGGSNILYLPTGSYNTATLTSSDSKSPIIVTGNVTLWVPGNITVQGSGYIQIMPGASLTLYGGATTTISGGGVANGTGLAANFTYKGLSSNTRIDYTGSAAFVGTVNAPQAALTISGSAGAYGAAIAKSVVLSGGAGFHYDQALAAGNGLVVTSWTEM